MTQKHIHLILATILGYLFIILSPCLWEAARWSQSWWMFVAPMSCVWTFIMYTVKRIDEL